MLKFFIRFTRLKQQYFLFLITSTWKKKCKWKRVYRTLFTINIVLHEFNSFIVKFSQKIDHYFKWSTVPDSFHCYYIVITDYKTFFLLFHSVLNELQFFAVTLNEAWREVVFVSNELYLYFMVFNNRLKINVNAGIFTYIINDKLIK